MKRDSRFWSGARELQRLCVLIVGAVIWRVPESLPEAIGVFGLVVSVIYGGGAWVNAKERDPEAQRAALEHLRFEKAGS